MPRPAAAFEPAQPTEAPSARKTDAVRPFYVGLSGGVAWAHAVHPDIATPNFVGPTMGLEAGYAVSTRWTVNFEISAMEKTVSRVAPGPFSVDSILEPQAGCDKCIPKNDRNQSGFITQAPLLLLSAAPGVEFTPFGRDGFYVGASGGLAMLQLIEPHVGASGTFRTGYRHRVGNMFSIGLETGVRAQAYSSSSAVMVYGSALFRPYF